MEKINLDEYLGKFLPIFRVTEDSESGILLPHMGSQEFDVSPDNHELMDAYIRMFKKGSLALVGKLADPEDNFGPIITVEIPGGSQSIYQHMTLALVLETSKDGDILRTIFLGLARCQIMRCSRVIDGNVGFLKVSGQDIIEIEDLEADPCKVKPSVLRNFAKAMIAFCVKEGVAITGTELTLSNNVRHLLNRMKAKYNIKRDEEIVLEQSLVKEIRELIGYFAVQPDLFPIQKLIRFLSIRGIRNDILLMTSVFKELIQEIEVSEDYDEPLNGMNAHLKDAQKRNGKQREAEKTEVEAYEKRLKDTEQFMNQEAVKEINLAIEQIRSMGNQPDTSDRQVTRRWLDWTLVRFPWGKTTKDETDLKKAKKILDEDHNGLDKIKDEILKFMAVRILNPQSKGQILCFVGPPGVGKTSLGKSIARALGRKFVKISLGGVRDEAQIRGHRRTYVAALPGEIIKLLCSSESSNPVFMIDEVDKAGHEGTQGNVESALMEVLDPEQNEEFGDHYLSFPVDLSSVLFIATANVIDTILPALKDRMRTLELPGYFQHEKVEIGKTNLISRCVEQAGLNGKVNVFFEDEALQVIISDHTNESGVRGLEHGIGSICRHVARHLVEGKLVVDDDNTILVNSEMVSDILGRSKIIKRRVYKTKIGEVLGLAVSLGYGGSATGSLLPIQCVLVPKVEGAKDVSYTGNLSTVMREADKNALSCLRIILSSMRSEGEKYLNTMNHHVIHFSTPNGGTPKDGPSAGITAFTALCSSVLKKKVTFGLAMTGEIDVYGRVSAIGGVPSKVIAAEQAGVKEIILPEENREDYEELPDRIKEKMKVHFVNNVIEASKIAFDEDIFSDAG